jgi:DNA repair exonuclease SbcCD ATPase subunit
MEGQVRAARWPLWVALALSLAWGGAFAAVLGAGELAGMAPREAILVLPFLFTGPILFFAIAAAIRSGTGRILLPDFAGEAAAEALHAEAATAGLASRLATLRATLSADTQALTDLGLRLEAQGKSAGSALADLKRATEGAVAAGTGLEASLNAGQTALEAMAARIRDLGEAIGTAHRAAEATGEQISNRAREITATVATAVADMSAALDRLSGEAEASRGAVDRLLERSGLDASAMLEAGTAAASALAEGVARHRETMEAATSDARSALAAIGADAARALGRHLDTLIGQARELEARIAAQAGATETLATSGEKAFQRLDARLEHSASTTGALLEGLVARIEAVNRGIDGLADPVRRARTAVAELDGAVASARETALGAIDVFDATLPARAVAASEAAATMERNIERLVTALDAAEAKARALSQPLQDGQAGIEAAAARFHEQREAIGIAGEALVVELEQARQLIAEVEQATEQRSLAAATGLVDALSRVRDVSAQATATMRQMLDGLIDEARASLGTAAQEALRASFAAPIAEKAREAEDAARAAAERSASGLAALATALSAIDARTETALAAIGEKSGAELASAAALLTDRLAGAAIDLTQALGRPMDAGDWDKWRRGERGLFGRRALSLLEKRDASAIRDLARSEPDFDRSARRYVGEFELLLDRLQASGQGALATFLRGTDQGRLAAVLSEALQG